MGTHGQRESVVERRYRRVQVRGNAEASETANAAGSGLRIQTSLDSNRMEIFPRLEIEERTLFLNPMFNALVSCEYWKNQDKIDCPFFSSGQDRQISLWLRTGQETCR
jgi:hypothetical protein